MTNDKFNSKLNEQWQELSKRFADLGNVTAKEALSVAGDVLKTLSKEFSTLGEQMEKWADSAKKRAANEAAKDNTDGSSSTPPPSSNV
jgi:polyhydroxyalkanoate synthesis regulator phasin